MNGRFAPPALWPALLLLPALLLVGCETPQPLVQTPARVQYLEAESLENQNLLAEAATNYQEVIDQHPGTRLGTFAYLKLGDIRFQQQKWVEAETNYKLFLTVNANSHLTPYVLSRLMKVNYEAGFTGVFFPEREVDRDMEPNRKLLLEYKRFFLLYPNSSYFAEVKDYYRAAKDTLAAHERVVADFYFERGQYNAAASRYHYLLRNFPNYPADEQEEVLRRLVEAYERDQRPRLAGEMRRIYELRFGEPLKPRPRVPETPTVGATQQSDAAGAVQ